MNKLSDLLKTALKPGAAPTANNTSPEEEEVKGRDPRSIAEQKAEAAGAKWRAEAEAAGEVEKEIGGPKGMEPTRYGDWEKAGRCVDF